jgi:hypothetical protein
MSDDVKWTDGWDMNRIVEFLGTDHVEFIKRQDSPVVTARTRALGAWNANLVEYFVVYTSLAMELSGEKVD